MPATIYLKKYLYFNILKINTLQNILQKNSNKIW